MGERIVSIDATRWAWQQTARPTHKLVLLSLADRAGEDDECHPSIARLEKDTGLYRETIMEAISQLELVGLIEVNRSLGRGNTYRLIGVEHREDQSAKPYQSGKAYQSAKADRSSRANQSEKADGNQSEKADQSGKADQSEKADATSREKPTTPVGKSRHRTYQEPIKNQPSNTRPSSGVDAMRHDFPDLPEEVARDFLNHRKAKRAPLTPSAWRQIAAEIRASGWTAEAALVEAMAAGWQGVKAEWLARRSGKPDQGGKHTAVGQRNAAAAARWLRGQQGEAE